MDSTTKRDIKLRKSRVFIAGDTTFYGRNIVNKFLESESWEIVILKEFYNLSVSDLSYKLNELKVNFVVVTSGLSFGIEGNLNRTADLCIGNITDLNLISASAKAGIEKLIYIGSSCMYPAIPAQSSKKFTVDDILTAIPELTSLNYTTIKLAGWSLCQAIMRQYGYRYITLIPSNVYGPWDDYDSSDSHVVASLIRKIYSSKSAEMSVVDLLGTGEPIRDFLHVSDLSGAVDFCLKNNDINCTINIGSGQGYQISDIASLISEYIGYKGEIRFNNRALNGTMFKVLDNSVIESYGWKNSYDINSGLKNTVNWYLNNHLRRIS